VRQSSVDEHIDGWQDVELFQRPTLHGTTAYHARFLIETLWIWWLMVCWAYSTGFGMWLVPLISWSKVPAHRSQSGMLWKATAPFQPASGRRTIQSIQNNVASEIENPAQSVSTNQSVAQFQSALSCPQKQFGMATK
jgi:hypothetical protein